MSSRSNQALVRNPLLAMPAMQALIALPASSEKTKIADLFKQASADARAKAEKCWRTHKAPMAAYWKAVAVYANHTSRAIRKGAA